MQKFIITAISALILTGCAGSPIDINSKPSHELSGYTTEQLCRAYRSRPSDAVWDNLVARGAVRDKNRSYITAGKAWVGMNSVELLCSWGPPADKFKTVTGTSTHVQWVYGSCTGCERHYAYTRNGFVTAIQQ